MSFNVTEINSYEHAAKQIIDRKIKNCVITGEAGTGKTTIIPTFIANEGYTVFVVIPTRLSVKGTYEYLLTTKNVTIKPKVRDSMGTAANSIINYSNSNITILRNILYGTINESKPEDTRLVFCTPGHMKKILLDILKYSSNVGSPPSTSFCSYLIVDEVHLGSMDIDLIILYWNYFKLIYPNASFPSLIKMTASPYNDITIFKYSSLRPKPMAVIDYFDNLNDVPIQFENRNIKYFDIIEYMPSVIKMYIDLAVSRDTDTNYESGIVLVFLPGISQIKYVENELKKMLYDIGSYDILYAHSSMKDEDLQNVVSVKPKDKRWRFVLATNIAETSITIPGVTYVFDSLLENYSFSDNNDIISLKMGFISKSSANQRAGRTGRDSNGVVVRFCYENFFNSLDENRQNEINRLSITNEVLKAMNSQIDTTRLFPNLLKYHPHVFEELQTLNCIEKNKNVYTVTKMGTFVSEIPLSIRYGIFLYNWVKIADPFPGIVLSVLLEMSNSIFLTNVSENIKSNVPLGTLLNPILKLWTKYPNLNPSRKKIVKFANENNLNVDGIVESIRKIFEIIRISPLLNFNYNKWGLQFAMREPFWINYNDPFRPNIKQIKQQFIIIGITYNITMALESNRIRKCKKSRQ